MYQCLCIDSRPKPVKVERRCPNYNTEFRAVILTHIMGHGPSLCGAYVSHGLPRGVRLVCILLSFLLFVVSWAPVTLVFLLALVLLQCGSNAWAFSCPYRTFFKHARSTSHSLIAQLRNATTSRSHGQVLVKCLLSSYPFRLFCRRRYPTFLSDHHSCKHIFLSCVHSSEFCTGRHSL